MLSVMDRMERPRKTRKIFTKTSWKTRENENVSKKKKVLQRTKTKNTIVFSHSSSLDTFLSRESKHVVTIEERRQCSTFLIASSRPKFSLNFILSMAIFGITQPIHTFNAKFRLYLALKLRIPAFK